jgi:hypothetical protein
MSVKRIGLSSLVVALCSLGVVHAQQPTPNTSGPDVLPLSNPNSGPTSSPYSPSSGTTPGTSGTGTTASASAVGAGVNPYTGEGAQPPSTPLIVLGPPASPWLVYPRSPCCCGPAGKCGPIGSELFIRSGPVFPLGGGIFGNFLRTGWDIEGGGRVLFFNPARDRAWTVSLSVSNIFARTGNDNEPITLFNVPVHTAITIPNSTVTTPLIQNVPVLQATVSSLNMTFVNVGFGREWYLLGSADPGAMHGCNWRIGVDGGGRWGSAMVQFNEINHHTDVVGGMYCAIHTDVEYPFRCGILQAGIRYEYNYIWTSILQDQNNGDFQSMNLLFQAGVRF